MNGPLGFSEDTNFIKTHISEECSDDPISSAVTLATRRFLDRHTMV